MQLESADASHPLRCYAAFADGPRHEREHNEIRSITQSLTGACRRVQ